VLVITAGGTATKTAAFTFVQSDISNPYMSFNYINANGTTVVGEASSYGLEGGSTGSILRSTSAGINAAIGLNGYAVNHLNYLNSVVSADGTVIAGSSSSDYPWNGQEYRSRAFRWVTSTGTAGTPTDLGTLPGDTDADTYQGLISSDGNVIVGRSWNIATPEVDHAFLWQKSTGKMTQLNVLTSGSAYINFNYINANGTTVVGEASTYSIEGGSTSSIWRSTSAGINAAIGLDGFAVNHLNYRKCVSAD